MIKVLPFNLKSVSARLPFYLSKGLLKLGFLDIYLTTFFRVRKIKNTSAITFILFFIMFKIEYKFRKWKKKIEKIFFVSEISASENVAISSLSLEENTCYKQSMA